MVADTRLPSGVLIKHRLVTRPPEDGPNRPGVDFENGIADYITVHETGNRTAQADAESHGRWLNKPYNYDDPDMGGPAYMWHVTVDDDSIVQHLPWSEQGWHAGDGRNGVGNTRSIGIEMCVNSAGDYEETLLNTAELICHLLEQGHGKKGIRQHNFFSSYRKNCPQRLRESNRWEEFLDLISDTSVDVVGAESHVGPEPGELPAGVEEAVATIERVSHLEAVVQRLLGDNSRLLKRIEEIRSDYRKLLSRTETHEARSAAQHERAGVIEESIGEVVGRHNDHVKWHAGEIEKRSATEMSVPETLRSQLTVIEGRLDTEDDRIRFVEQALEQQAKVYEALRLFTSAFMEEGVPDEGD